MEPSQEILAAAKISPMVRRHSELLQWLVTLPEREAAAEQGRQRLAHVQGRIAMIQALRSPNKNGTPPGKRPWQQRKTTLLHRLEDRAERIKRILTLYSFVSWVVDCD